MTTNEDLVFTLTVSDGSLTDTDTVTVTIRASNQTPVANAGADQSVQTTLKRTTVNLDGSASSDADGDTLTYTWTQTAGTTVTLENASQATARFTTDQVTASTTLTFQLQVSDGNASHTDTVDHHPDARRGEPGAGGDPGRHQAGDRRRLASRSPRRRRTRTATR